MITTDFSSILAAYWGIFVFGIFFNGLVKFMENRRYLDGFTWLAVVVGVAGTLIISLTFIPSKYVYLMFGAFACSGLPMAFGAIARYVLKREASQKSIIDEVQ